MSQPPPGWKVPKPKPPWGYRKTPPPSGPSPDYTAPAEEHREELRSQQYITPMVVEPKVVEVRGVDPYIILSHQVDDYLFRQTEEDLPTQDIPVLREPVKKGKKALEEWVKGKKEAKRAEGFEEPYRRHVLRETDRPPKGSTAQKIDEWLMGEERFFRDVKTKFEVAVGRTRREAEKAKLRDDDIIAGLIRSKAGLLSVGKALVGTTSFFVRPKRIVETPGDVYRFIMSPEAQAVALQQIIGDPESAVFGVAGTLLGSALVSDVAGRLKGKKVTDESYTRTVKSYDRRVHRLTGRRAISPKTGIKVKSVPLTREVKGLSDKGFTGLTGRRAISPKPKGGWGRTDAIPRYIKLKGEWFRTGEGLFEASDLMDPSMALSAVDDVFKLKDTKPPFMFDHKSLRISKPTTAKPKIVTTLKQIVDPEVLKWDYKRLGISSLKTGPKTVTTLRQTLGPQSSRLGLLGSLGAIAEKDLIDSTFKDLAKSTTDFGLYDKPDFEQRQGTYQITEPTVIQPPTLKPLPGFLPPPPPIPPEPKPPRKPPYDPIKDIPKPPNGGGPRRPPGPPDFRFDPPLKIDFPMPKRKGRRKGLGRYEEIWGETRKYPLARRKAFFKKLLGGLI